MRKCEKLVATRQKQMLASFEQALPGPMMTALWPLADVPKKMILVHGRSYSRCSSLGAKRLLRPEAFIPALLRLLPYKQDVPNRAVHHWRSGPAQRAFLARFQSAADSENGDPSAPMHLIIARNALDPKEIKYFLSNAPTKTRVALLLLVAFSRWRVERCFQDGKTELGFDHYEGRDYEGMMRHQTITAVTYLFLARTRERNRGEKPGAHRVPNAHGFECLGAILVAHAQAKGKAISEDSQHHRLSAKQQRPGAQESPQRNHPQTRRPRLHLKSSPAMPMEPQIAL